MGYPLLYKEMCMNPFSGTAIGLVWQALNEMYWASTVDQKALLLLYLNSDEHHNYLKLLAYKVN